MNPFTTPNGWTLVAFGVLAMAMPAGADDKATHSVEIREAEATPGPGLKEATIPGSLEKVYLHGNAALTKADIAGALVKEKSDQTPTVEVRLTDQGRKSMARLSEGHANKRIAILVDGKLVVAPVIRGKITRDRITLTGNFSKTEAEQIATALRGK